MKDVLARWRDTRSPLLADVLCCEPFDTSDWPEFTTVGWAKPRIEALPDDDPRTTVILVQKLADAAWRDAKSRPLWEVVFAKLLRLRDVRCIAKLRALAADPPDYFQPKTTKWVAEEMARVADALAKVKVPADDAKTKRLAQSAKIPPRGFFPIDSTASRDALLAQVWAAPDDLELRAVVGDALQELGDPRGELITLQLRGGKRAAKTIDKLLEDHVRDLAGPIYPLATGKSPLTFEAGFLARCSVGTYFASKKDWADAAIAPHWATVAHIEFRGTPKRKWFQSWWANPNLRSLREIKVADTLLARKSTASPWRFAKLARNPAPYELKLFELILRAMPPSQRVEPPTGDHPIAALARDLVGRNQPR